MIIGIDASRAQRARRTGTERYSLEIIRHLLRLDRAVEHQWRLYLDRPVAADLFAAPGAVDRALNLETRILQSMPIWTHRQLGREVRRHPPDVLFVPAHVIPLHASRRRHPPSVVTVHDLGYRKAGAMHTPAQRLHLELSTRWNVYSARRVICVSQATARDVARHYGRKQETLDVIYEATAPAKVRSAAQLAATRRRYGLDEPYLYFVGTIQPRKNLVRLIQAYALFRRRSALDWPLVLTGQPGWKQDPIMQAIGETGLEDRIKLTGYVPEEDAADLLAAAHLFCYPSLFEGFGLPVLEAQQRGIPVMTSNNSALPEIGGDGALYVNPLDVEEIADAMLALSTDEALRKRLIAAGHENVKRFSWEKAAQETLAVLEQTARG